jgi:hypothetical protein
VPTASGPTTVGGVNPAIDHAANRQVVCKDNHSLHELPGKIMILARPTSPPSTAIKVLEDGHLITPKAQP